MPQKWLHRTAQEALKNLGTIFRSVEIFPDSLRTNRLTNY